VGGDTSWRYSPSGNYPLVVEGQEYGLVPDFKFSVKGESPGGISPLCHFMASIYQVFASETLTKYRIYVYSPKNGIEVIYIIKRLTLR